MPFRVLMTIELAGRLRSIIFVHAQDNTRSDHGNIEHSTIVITGASSGIGRALALEMARRGHTLGLTARRMALLEQLRDELHAAHGKKLRVELATLDVCQSASVGPTLHELFDRLGGIDTRGQRRRQ